MTSNYNKPLVTVYITNYNYARFLKQSIESVLNQTFKQYEILIIDDGSTDNSRDIIESYRGYSNIEIIYQQNKGLNITNNIAMRSANGKYLMRLDADDFLVENALELMVSKLESNPDIGLVFPDYYYVDAAGNVTGEERRHNFEEEVSLYDQPAHGACTMVRLSYLINVGGYNENFNCQDGYELWIKFISRYKVTNINTPLFYYRRHSNNLTNNEEKILQTRKEIKELFVRQNHSLPTTLCVIPVRKTIIGSVNWPLHEVNGKTVLEHKIETCLKTKNIKHVVLSVSDSNVFEFIVRKQNYGSRVTVLQRPDSFAGLNENLYHTMSHALDHLLPTKYEAVVSVSLDYPFTGSDIIDDAINTLVLFNSDTVISVRPDTQMYYQHTGHSLKPILEQDKFTRLEREALYKGAGGIILSKVDSIVRSKRMISGRVSHVVVDRKTAFGVFSDFDFQIFNLLQADQVIGETEKAT